MTISNSADSFDKLSQFNSLYDIYNADQSVLTNNFLCGHIDVSVFVEWKHLISKYYM